MLTWIDEGKLLLSLNEYMSTIKIKLHWALTLNNQCVILVRNLDSHWHHNKNPTMHKCQSSIQHMASLEICPAMDTKVTWMIHSPYYQYQPISIFFLTSLTNICHNWMFTADNKSISSPSWRKRRARKREINMTSTTPSLFFSKYDH